MFSYNIVIKILFNSWIIGGISKMLQLVQREVKDS